MALKDMKSDLSKFRVPKKTPLESKERTDIKKNQNQTPLSSMIESAPKIPRSQTTTNKEGVKPQKVNQTEKFKGETSPKPMDNSEKFLGETNPKPMSLEERYLGQTDPTLVNQSEKFKGETSPTEMNNQSQFLGETSPKEANNSEQFLGETSPTEMNNKSQFLGETSPKPMSLEERYLGETTPNESDISSKFLGETTPNEMNNKSQFLGETTPNESDRSSKFLGETTPTPMSITNGEASLGETTPNGFTFTSKFLGETTPSAFGFTSQFLGETDTITLSQGDKDKGETTPNKFTFNSKLENEGKEFGEVNYQTDIHALGFNSKFGGVEASKFVGVNPDNTVFDGTTSLFGNIEDNSFKVGGTYSDSYNNAGGMNSGQDGFGIGKGQAERKSPSFLDEQYSKFNLKDDSYNKGLGLFRQPFILRGIQRRKVSKGEPQVWGVGGFHYDEGAIRGGIVTSTVRALVDVARIGSWFASVPGILWGAKQFGLQRSQKFGKVWTPVGMLAAIGGQHIGLKAQRPGLIPLVDSTFQYQDNTLNIVKDKLLKIYNIDMLVGLNPSLVPTGMPFLSQTDALGGFNSLYGINVMGPGLTTRGDNTFKNLSIFGPYADSIINKTKTEYSNDGNNVVNPLDLANTNISLATIQTKLKKGQNVEIDSVVKDGTTKRKISITNPFEKTKSTGGETHKLEKLDKDALIKQYETIAYGKMPDRVPGDTEINDFRSLLTNENSKKIVEKANYVENSLQSKYKFKNPGAIGADRTDYTTSHAADPIQTSGIDAEAQDDLVQLIFDAEGGKSRLQFRGTINGVTDTFSPGWEGFKYNGRADEAYKYGTFGRSLSFNFQVYPTTKAELKPLYAKLERLSTMTMPVYGTSGYQGTLIRFTMGKMFINHLSLIESLSYTFSDEVPWDIDEGLSMGIDVSVGLKILSDELPQYANYKVYDLEPKAE